VTRTPLSRSKGQLAGGGACCGGLAHSLFKFICDCRSSGCRRRVHHTTCHNTTARRELLGLPTIGLYLTPPRRLCFCPSVFVCPQDHSKSCVRVLMNISGEALEGVTGSRCGYTNFQSNFYHCGIGASVRILRIRCFVGGLRSLECF